MASSPLLPRNNDEVPNVMTPLKLIASRIAVSLFLLMAFIQVCIAVGLLPVTIVWGGSQHERTWQNSCASVVAAALLCGMAWIIHQRATCATTPSFALRLASWIIAIYMVLNTVGNFTSPSWVERYIFGSMTIGMAVGSLVVASSKLDVSNHNHNHIERSNSQSIAP